MDPVDVSAAELPFARLLAEEIGWSHEVIPNARELRFEEMEYALPAAQGLACFREVRRRVKDHWRQSVGWRVLYRAVAADDAYLSLAHGRSTVTISLHQNATLPFREYFSDIEPIFRAHGGRPHWGKKHTLRAVALRPLYPGWDRFLEIRQRMDPGGVFLNPYLRELLGVSMRTPA
jgi:FAD/FMN-containing dehydrogenase